MKQDTRIEAMREEYRSIKNNLTTDEVVRSISYLWASLYRKDGKRLEDRDLLKGNIVKPMAEQLSSAIGLKNLLNANHKYKNLRTETIYKKMVGSFNAIWLQLRYITRSTQYYLKLTKSCRKT